MMLSTWLHKCRHVFSSEQASPIMRWSLDYPSPKREAWLQPSGRVVQGWVLLADWARAAAEDIRILADWHADFELCHALAIERPDVVETILQVSAEGHPQRHCGFRFTLPADVGRFRLWLQLGAERWLLQQVEVPPVHTNRRLKVLKGEAGWLFLDNDTNLSVDQYTGHLQLTATGVESWRKYVEALLQTAEGLRRPPLLLVAPAKESVVGRFHPEPPAQRSLLQPVLELLPKEQVLYPVQALSVGLAESAFFKTDSHWTQRGAGLVSRLLALRLGVSAESVDALLSQDQYVERIHVGDLGSKLEPGVGAPADFLRNFNYRSCIVYDNGLPNFGRLMVMQSPAALSDTTCLIFGSSSSYSMFNYLCRFFSRLVFVHSAGNLDSEVIAALAPDYLVAQTNARFMIRPPVADYSLACAMQEKQLSLEVDELERQSRLRNVSGLTLLHELGLSRWHLPVPSMDEH